jgi:hypothetical protein
MHVALVCVDGVVMVSYFRRWISPCKHHRQQLFCRQRRSSRHPQALESQTTNRMPMTLRSKDFLVRIFLDKIFPRLSDFVVNGKKVSILRGFDGLGIGIQRFGEAGPVIVSSVSLQVSVQKCFSRPVAVEQILWVFTTFHFQSPTFTFWAELR